MQFSDTGALFAADIAYPMSEHATPEALDFLWKYEQQGLVEQYVPHGDGYRFFIHDQQVALLLADEGLTIQNFSRVEHDDAPASEPGHQSSPYIVPPSMPY